MLSIGELRARRSEKWATYPPDVLPAFIAEMDVAPPIAVIQTLAAAVAAGDFGYAHPSELAAAFKDFARDVFAWDLSEEYVFAAPDVMSAIEQILKVRTQPGDAVVVNPPVYPPFFEVVRAAQRRIVEVPLIHSDEGWSLDFDALELAFAAGARAYLLCSPHNPIGRVWTQDELRRVAALTKQFSVTVIADEIHAPLAFESRRHTPYLSVAGPGDFAFAAYSASKAWNIPGLKCGLAVAGSEKCARDLQKHWASNPSELTWRIGNLGVLATIAALRDRSDWLRHLQRHLAGNLVHLRSL
ncbi:MAG: aminotransferase class I/II-fold pyridoxal phosphate-dependent enzyme, partial [Candidatus Eremiobacteraeota bacterium]|nr:aminotransferase class I/II-fold pyridoxal phosphate-dependent enzyme [Candidatus Eremiobacteraeota bacterium]